MNKLLILALLATAIFAIRTEDLHDQAKPAPVTPAPHPAQPAPPAQQQPKPAHPQNNQQKPAPKPATKPAAKRVSYDSEPGDPFGNEPAVKRTCVKAPCNEPTTGCAAPKKWNTIFYLVPTVDGRNGRFVGYECKWFDKQHIWFSI